MRNMTKVSIILLAVGLLFIRPTPSYAWHGGHDHFRFGLDLSVPIGGYYGGYYGGYGYYDPAYYNPGYTYVSAPVYQPIVVNGLTYYLNNGNYYIYTSYGYQLVTPPAAVIQATPVATTAPVQVSNMDMDDSFTLNIPSDKGGYTPVVIKRSGSGFIGPQGEFYSEFPRVAQLKAMYGK